MSGQLELGEKKIIRKGEFYLFSVGFSELILILIIAYVFVGPKDLPKIAKWLGNAVKRTRSFIRDIKKESGLDDMMNEINVKEEINNLDAEINETVNEIKQNTLRR